MADEWIYEHAGRIHGPVSLADLRASLALGLVWPTDLVRRRIVQDWAPAGRFPELREPPLQVPHPDADGSGEPRHGFTLVELLVVIAIIGTLVGLTASFGTDAMWQKPHTRARIAISSRPQPSP